MNPDTISRVGRFNSRGLDAFSRILKAPFDELQNQISDLTDKSDYVDWFDCVMEIRPVESRLELARILFDSLHNSKSGSLYLSDQGMWSWLAARWMKTLFQSSVKNVKVGEQARWILDKQKSRFYRHLLAGPFFIYQYHYPNPEKALSILFGSPIVPGELVGQIAATAEIAYSVGAEVATKLYIDDKSGKAKKGSRGMGPGSPRRLTAAYLNQIDLTIDYRGMSADKIIQLLPEEFDKFK